YAAFANVLISFSIKTVVWFSAIPFAAIPLKLNLFSVVAYFIVIISLLALPGGWHRGMRVIVILIVLNVFVWKDILTPNEPLAKIAINDIGQGRAIIFRTNSETILIDAGVRKSQFSRIDRQLKELNACPLSAFVQMNTRDSLVANIPALAYQMASDTSLFMKTIFIYRPTRSVLKIVSKEKNLLILTSLKDFCESPFYRADVIIVRLRRFDTDEQDVLERWRKYALPQHIVIELSPFMPGREKQRFYRYARTKPEIQVPARGGQILIM
ncbi:MAG: hypothetical protein HGB19_09040, partial [Chlorobiales bacterium]|nr:hypothetical protein [Chlorobiales bacterium]